MEISIIICTYNRAELLIKALKSLDNQDFESKDYEIIVIDDGSMDNTDELVSSFKSKTSLKYFKRPHIGRASARNFGIKQAEGKYILFVDDDILASPNLLTEHYNYLKINGKIVVRGPVIDTPYHNLNLNKGVNIKDYSMAFFCTCNASVNKKILLEIGGFDESFTEYGWEDTELGLRLRNLRYKVKFNLKAIIYHYKPKGADNLGEYIQKAKELGKTAVKFYKKHPNWRVKLATGINIIHIFWHYLTSNIIIKNIAQELLKNKRISLNSNFLYFLKNKIFNYYYHKSILESLKIKGRK